MAHSPAVLLRNAPDADIGIPGPKQRPVQVLRFDLPQEILDELLQSSGKENDLQVSFGKTPSLRYGKTSIDLQISPSAHRNELYQHSSAGKTKDFDFGGLVTHSVSLRRDEDPTADMDSALATLQQQMANLSKEKQSMQSTFVNEVKPGKRTTTTGKRSLPAHRRNMFSGDAGRPSVTSPSLGATLAAPSASQSSTTQSSKTSAIRIPLLHLLAVKPLSEAVVAKKLHIPKHMCLSLLEKYAKRTESDRLWQLTDRWYKELDVWKFPYDPATSERQSAIDNAVRAYDRMRLSKDDKLWQLLLPKDERGKGKVLSKLNLSNFNAIKTSAAKPEPSSLGSDTITIPSAPEPMARSKSKDTLTKEILSKRTATRTSAKVTKPTQTPRAPKAKPGAKKSTPNVKSAEFVHDSDEEAADDANIDELSNEKPQDEKPLKKSAATALPKNASKALKNLPAAAVPKARVDLPAEAAKTRPFHSGSISSDSSLSSISSKSSPHHQPTSSVSSTGSASSPNKKRKLIEPTTTKTSPPPKAPSPVKLSHPKSSPKGQTSPSRGSLFGNSQIKAAKAVPRNVTRPGAAHRPVQEPPAKRPAAAETQPRDDNVSRKRPKTDSNTHSRQPSRTQHDLSKLPEPSIVDLQERKRDLQREYITLHLEVSSASQPPEAKVQEVWRLFDELNRLKQEISRLEGSPLDVDESTPRVRLNAKTTALVEKQFSQDYPIYKKLYDELASMKAPPPDKMAELWAMQGRLTALQRLMDDNSKDAVIEKVRIDMKSPADPESPTVPLSRRQTLDLYRKYYKYFATYEKQNAVLQASGSVSMQEVDDDWKMRIRLEDMRREIVRGFEHMTRGFEMEGTDDEEFADEEDPDLSASSPSSDGITQRHKEKQEQLSESEMKTIARRFADEWPAWFALRSKLLAAPFGTVDPDAMTDLWSRQGRLKRWRWQVFRASKAFPCPPKLA